LIGRENFPSEKIFAHHRSSLVRRLLGADTMPARRANASQSAKLGTFKLFVSIESIAAFCPLKNPVRLAKLCLAGETGYIKKY
jgi:hypothetical protein